MFRLSFWSAVFVVIASILFVALLVLPPTALILRGISAQAWERLPESGIPAAIVLSLVTSATSAVTILLLGTPLAYVLARWKFPLKPFISLMIELPIMLPPAVAGLALLITFGRRGLLGDVLNTVDINLPFTTAAVVIAQTFVAAPFFIRSAQTGFLNVPEDIEDAARVDGASDLELFWHVILPLSRRSLAVGLTLSWTRALGEFGATMLFAGNLQGRTQTMPLLVYSVLERDIDAAIWTGLILVFIALAALSVVHGLTRVELPRRKEEP
jgi:molybdate transport system permease protein